MIIVKFGLIQEKKNSCLPENCFHKCNWDKLRLSVICKDMVESHFIIIGPNTTAN